MSSDIFDIDYRATPGRQVAVMVGALACSGAVGFAVTLFAVRRWLRL